MRLLLKHVEIEGRHLSWALVLVHLDVEWLLDVSAFLVHGVLHCHDHVAVNRLRWTVLDDALPS